MAFNLTSPVTGAAISGLTTPSFTLVDDTPPANLLAKQKAVIGIGGTQPGVTAHSITAPFTLTMVRPSTYKVLGQPSVAGVIRAFPKNTTTLLTRKGVHVLANQPTQVMLIRTELSVPAGADSYDAVSVKSALSAHIGMLWQIAQGIADTTLTGTL